MFVENHCIAGLHENIEFNYISSMSKEVSFVMKVQIRLRLLVIILRT